MEQARARTTVFGRVLLRVGWRALMKVGAWVVRRECARVSPTAQQWAAQKAARWASAWDRARELELVDSREAKMAPQMASKWVYQRAIVLAPAKVIQTEQ